VIVEPGPLEQRRVQRVVRMVVAEHHVGDLGRLHAQPGQRVEDQPAVGHHARVHHDRRPLVPDQDNGAGHPVGGVPGAQHVQERGHPVINDFFSEDVAGQFVRAHGRPDVVTFTNVFAHIEDLKGVIRALKIVAHERTLIVVENHYLGAILERNQFDTFYHEHPRTYSLTSFVHIARSLGMAIVRAEFPKRYGGNIRVFLSADPCDARTRETLAEVDQVESGFGASLGTLAERIATWKKNKFAQILDEVGRHGPLATKAFPGRAAIPVKLLNLSTAHISAAYEKPSSVKIGNYIPGTRIPIRSDDEFTPALIGDGPVLNLAWHIADEIKGYLRQRGYSGSIIDIISPEDFAGRK